MDAYGYTRLDPQSTNLPVTIWIGTPMGFDGGQPRVLAASVLGTSKELGRYFSVHLENVAVFQDETVPISRSVVYAVQDFVRLNQFALIAHWLGKIDTVETIGLLAIPESFAGQKQGGSQ